MKGGVNVKKNKNAKKIWKIIGLLLVFIGLVSFLTLWYQVNRYEEVEIEKTNEALGIKEINVPVQIPDVIDVEGEEPLPILQVAIFGLDNRANETPRSDAILVAQFDQAADDVKIISLMRDMDVRIDGHGTDKLNHAYAYGGPQLAIKTINQNFGTAIKNYVAVDFKEMANAVDAIGGVTVNITSEEKTEINKNTNNKIGQLLNEGDVLLNGEQAVTYARIRSIDSDFKRTERQRNLMESLLTSIKGADKLEFVQYWMKIAPNVELSMSKEELLDYGMAYVTGNYGFSEKRIPEDGHWSSGRKENGAWIMKVDESYVRDSIKHFFGPAKKPGLLGPQDMR